MTRDASQFSDHLMMPSNFQSKPEITQIYLTLSKKRVVDGKQQTKTMQQAKKYEKPLNKL